MGSASSDMRVASVLDTINLEMARAKLSMAKTMFMACMAYVRRKLVDVFASQGKQEFGAGRACDMSGPSGHSRDGQALRRSVTRSSIRLTCTIFRGRRSTARR